MNTTPTPKIIEYREGVDDLGTPYSHVALTYGDLYACHTSFRRGGCLYAGTVVLRNFSPRAARDAYEVDITSWASDSDAHVAYLISLAKKHVGILR